MVPDELKIQEALTVGPTDSALIFSEDGSMRLIVYKPADSTDEDFVPQNSLRAVAIAMYIDHHEEQIREWFEAHTGREHDTH